MSYILDALKKADAEREQGQVPGLHTPTAQLETDLAPGSGRTPAPWVMGLGAALVLAALGTAWLWTRPLGAPVPTSAPVQPAPHPALAQAPQALPATAAPNLVTAPALMTAPPPVIAAPVTPPAATPVPAVQPPTPAVQPAVRPPVIALPRTSLPAAAVIPTSPPARAPIHVDPAPTPAASAKVPTLAELPEDVRRSLPALTVSGAMYSDQPASRMLLINNRVFHEGDQPVAGLVLEEIRLKSAVFRYQGTRYAVSY